MNKYQKGQLKNIKVIIWDLDETLWKGTIDDGDIPVIPDINVEFIKGLTDHGIVNSICSKNDKGKVKKILSETGLWDYFVFPSIEWSPKGKRISQMLKTMGLRSANTLFIDDNHLNLEEAEFYAPGIYSASPKDISSIKEDLDNSNIKIDKTHKRLKQYKILQEKAKEKSEYGSAREFLNSCNIHCCIHTDCLNEVDRIYELIQRSNQLNFTKKRSSKDEVLNILHDNDYKCGTVWVNDRFGDYGMVGFFAVKGGEAYHFLFSCRTIGMGIEQYVYQVIGCPKINIVGDVVSSLGSKESLQWINQDTAKGHSLLHKEIANTKKILIIGGCDLEQTAYYLEKSGLNFDSQYNYVANKRFEAHPDSLVNIIGSVKYSKEQKKYIIDHCVFYDDSIYKNKLFNDQYDVIIYSPLIDYANGLYESKEYKDLYVVYGNKDHPDISTPGYMTESEQKDFRKYFNFKGSISQDMFKNNLKWFLKQFLNKSYIYLLNGAEIDFPHPEETGRYLDHIQYNKILQEVSNEYDNVKIINVSGLVKDVADYSDSIRHYNRRIYYEIAQCILVELKAINVIDSAEISHKTVGIRGMLSNLKYRKDNGRLRDDIHAEGKKILNNLGLLNIAYNIRKKLNNMGGYRKKN